MPYEMWALAHDAVAQGATEHEAAINVLALVYGMRPRFVLIERVDERTLYVSPCTPYGAVFARGARTRVTRTLLED